MSSVIKVLLDDPKNTEGRQEGPPPEWMASSIQYETLMGSKAYGTATEYSDSDVYSWCIPPRELVFPFLNGNIPLFDEAEKPWGGYQLHKIKTQENEWDINCYSVAKFFGLARQGNPNIIDSLWVDEDDVLYMTEVGEMVFRQPTMFISKRVFHRYSNYAIREHEVVLKWLAADQNGETREASDKKPRKAAYHAVRLLLQMKQLMKNGIMELKQDSDVLKSIRQGENLFDVSQRIHTLKEEAQVSYSKSRIQDVVDDTAIRNLLLAVIETQYGTLPTSAASVQDLDGLNRLASYLDRATNELKALRVQGDGDVSPS